MVLKFRRRRFHPTAQEHSIRTVLIAIEEFNISIEPAMWWTVVKEAAANWSSHKDARQGAALAYYSVFSLGPIIVIAIAVAALLFGRDAVTSQVMSSIKEMLGDTGARAVEAMLAGASRPAAGRVATVVGIGALLIAAVGVFVQLKDALNVVWEVEESSESGLWHFARDDVLSFAAVLALGFLLLVSLVASAALAAAGKYAAHYLPEGILHVVSMLISFGIVMVLFAMIFKWLPDVSVGWRDVWLGAFLTALFFEMGKAAIGFYIGKQGLESTYGAAASIVVVLIWVYYTSQIILMGAEVTHSYARHAGPLKRHHGGASKTGGCSVGRCIELTLRRRRAPPNGDQRTAAVGTRAAVNQRKLLRFQPFAPKSPVSPGKSRRWPIITRSTTMFTTSCRAPRAVPWSSNAASIPSSPACRSRPTAARATASRARPRTSSAW